MGYWVIVKVNTFVLLKYKFVNLTSVEDVISFKYVYWIKDKIDENKSGKTKLKKRVTC